MPKHSAIVSHDEEWGITKTFHRHHDGDWTYQTTQDITDIVEWNKHQQTEARNRFSDFRKVASIPLTVLLEIEKTHGINFYNKDHWPAFKRLLNSNEYRHLRTDTSVL